MVDSFFTACYNPIFDSWKEKNGCEASKIKAYSRFFVLQISKNLLNRGIVITDFS